VAPNFINALSNESLPYFYRGFYQLDKDLVKSRSTGVIWHKSTCSIITCKSRMININYGYIKLLPKVPCLIEINGLPVSYEFNKLNNFIRIMIEDEIFYSIHHVLGDIYEITIKYDGDFKKDNFGISSVESV
jgi:hypothetical protein